MGAETAISWCDHTFNGWWGCMRVSEACRNCYAEALDARFVGPKSAIGNESHWGTNAPRRFFGDAHWKEPLKWNRAAAKTGIRGRVFCSSMSDVFESREDLIPHRVRLWNLIRECKHLDWLLLTKRPENFETMLPWMDRGKQVSHPWANVWLGVTAEDNERAEERILTLRAVPATVRFVSCEPILEHIGADTWDLVFGYHKGHGPVHWLIVGDESGSGARPAQTEWIRTARDAAVRHDIAFHFKQWAGLVRPDGIGPESIARGRKIHLPLLDGVQWAQFPAGGVA